MSFGGYGMDPQRQMDMLLEQKQMKDFMKLYSNLVERCFADCVNDFTSTKLATKEETCVNRCVDKFLKHTERVGARFAEQNQALAEKQEAEAMAAMK